jgi:hypothetical protein
MSRQKSKLKAMAAAGDPWAIATLAKARAQAMAPARPKDAAFEEALRDARDIREWTDGPRAASWRIYRLAQAMIDARR